MRSYIIAVPTALSALLTSAPALASSGIQIPEPSNIVMFGLGLAGLIIGRQVVKHSGHKPDSLSPDSSESGTDRD